MYQYRNFLKNNKIYYTILLLIIVLSFSFLSYLKYPSLSSDDALMILMTEDYSLPSSLYCWGQDRGGTLIAFLSSNLKTVFPLPSIYIVSIVTYLILFLGFLGYSSLLKTNFLKITLAIIWFLPFYRFVDLVRFPIGIQYSLIGGIILFIQLYIKNKQNNWAYFNLFIIGVLSLLSVWVSDLAAINLITMVFGYLLFQYYHHKKVKIEIKEIVTFVITVATTFFFIKYAKSNATSEITNFKKLNNLDEIRNSISILYEYFKDLVLFKKNEPLTSVYVYLALVFFTYLSIIFYKNKRKLLQNFWIMFFLADIIIILTVILTSKWVQLNQLGRWYFVGTYISIALFSLLTIQQINLVNAKIFLLIMSVFGSFVLFYNLSTVFPKRLKPKVDYIKEIEQLGDIGLIGNFWNSYIYSVTAPQQIIATPHDNEYVRNYKLVEKVFEQPRIYVIKDMWFDTFPDTLMQFDRTLVKKGTPFDLADANMCEYILIK